VTRRRLPAKIHELPPDVVPRSEQDERQAVQAIATMIAQWWREHDRDDEQRTMATTPPGITTEPVDEPQ
jgi:hypothetical protein